MEGTIKIEAIAGMGVSVEMDVKHVSKLDMMGVFDGLFSAFGLDDEDRKMMGILLAAGGINAMPGVQAVRVETQKELFEILKKMRKNGDKADTN